MEGCIEGFDRSRSTSGCYGHGVYFARRPLYCAFFIDPPRQSHHELPGKELHAGRGAFLMLANVALGQCEEYGREVSEKTRVLTSPSAGYDSWCGTEGDLCAPGLSATE